MSNPSTIWAQLSIPNPPSGSVPFVASDGITIVTEVANFYYNPLTHQLGLMYQITFGYTSNLVAAATVTNNSVTGRVALLTGNSVLTVNNSLIGPNSIVFVSVETSDLTALYVKKIAVISASGQFQITMNAAATANVQLAYIVVN